MSRKLICLFSFVLMVSQAGNTAEVARWDFDETSGTTATDRSGLYVATLQGSDTLDVDGKFGSGIDFAGDGGMIVDAANSEAFRFTGDFSIALWINPDTTFGDFVRFVDISAADGGLADSYRLMTWNGANADNFRFMSRQTGSSTSLVHSRDIALDTWTLCVVRHDLDGDITLNVLQDGDSVDTAFVGTNSESWATAGSIDYAAGDLKFGRLIGGGRKFDGQMDGVAFYDEVLTDAQVADIFNAAPSSGQIAASPKPADEAIDVLRDVVLSWEPGESARTHTVYFGTMYEDVNDASPADRLGVLVSENQDASTFEPVRLSFDQAYYWRVDEVNAAPDFAVFKGDVWSFTTEPVSIPITSITALASSSFGQSVPENTINGSGLVDDLHGTSASDMWISTGIPATVEYAFDRAYKLHELWVWNSNQTIEAFIGFGAKDVVIEHSLDGENWIVLEGVSELAQAPGVDGYAANNIIDFGGVTAQHVRVSINTVHGFAPQASLSEIRFFSIPTLASRPSPDSGATNLAPDLLLSWGRNGREADSHDIYIGTDVNDLSLAGRVSESSFDTLASDLQLGQTYYWQVVEVNAAMDPMEWVGDVWSFTTVDTIIVDDMESYKDEEFLEIWATWVDGFDDPGNNGAIVGAVPSLGDFSPETAIVYGGDQSLPIHFDNSGAPRSEATHAFDAAMDWSKHGIQSLVLFFRGSPANTGGQLYLKINDTKVAYDGASSDLMHLGWNRWTIPLSSVSASTLSRVTSLTIGIEGNGSGVLYVDEIRLTEDARVVVTPTQPSDEGLVAHYAFDGDASDSTGQSPGTLFGLTSFVPGVIGQALRLDGINSYVAIDGLLYDSSGFSGVTVTAWIRTDIEDDQIIASFDRSDYWRLEINLSGAGPGQIGWDVMTDTGQLDSGSSSRVDDGEWHHVAGVFDNGTSTIFIDGYHEAPVHGGSTIGTGNTRYGFVGVGSEAVAFDGAKNGNPNFFVGDVDDFRIYHRALSAAEVAGMAGRTDPFEQP